MAAVNILVALALGAACWVPISASYMGGVGEIIIAIFAVGTVILAIASLIARRQRLERARMFALVSAATYVGLLVPIALRDARDAAFWVAGAVIVFSANLAASCAFRKDRARPHAR
jgi:hypothetical protein